jgi:hypothetical protein
MNQNILLRPIKTERLTPDQFIKTVETSKNIEKSRFIPPKIGDGTFGAFEVTYRFAELKNG